jgi:hypothetical protein
MAETTHDEAFQATGRRRSIRREKHQPHLRDRRPEVHSQAAARAVAVDVDGRRRPVLVALTPE